MKKNILLSACLSLFGLATHAQTTAKYGGFGFFDFGLSSFSNAPLNNLLSANGYSTLGSSFLSTGGQGLVMINSFVLGGEGGGFGSQDFSRPNTTGRFNAGYGTFQFGYAWRAGKKGLFYPMVGYGAFGTTLQIEDNNSSMNLNTSFATPNQVVNISSSTGMLSASANFILTVLGGDSEDGSGGTMVGLSVGGFYCPTPSSFQMNNRAMTEVPNYNPSGFYIRLKFGGGGYGSAD